MHSDDVAQDFVVRFYEALITGKFSVRKAFDIAVITVQRRIEPESFLLLPEGEKQLTVSNCWRVLDIRSYKASWALVPIDPRLCDIMKRAIPHRYRSQQQFKRKSVPREKELTDSSTTR